MAPHPFAPSSAHDRPARVLVVTGRSAVIEELLRLAAAAGVELEVAPDLVAARGSWTAAPLVILDDAEPVATEGVPPPRREDVVLLGDSVDDATVWQRAVRLGAQHVVFLPEAEEWLVDRLAEVREGGLRAAHVVAVVGGRGGAGATTLAAGLAVTAVSRRSRVLLVDLDPMGGGIDLAVGIEAQDGLRWTDLMAARGRVNGASLCDALPKAGELPVLSWDRGADTEVPFEAARAVLDAAVRVCDVVIVDLPRTAGPAASHAAGRADDLLVVVPSEVRAVAAAERVLRCYRPLATSVRAVVRGPAPTGLTADAVCDALAIDLAGVLRPEPRLAQSFDRGDPPGGRGRGPLADLCRALLAAAGR